MNNQNFLTLNLNNMKKILFIALALFGLTVSAQDGADLKDMYRAAEKNTIEQAKQIAEVLNLNDKAFYLIKDALEEKNNMLAQNPTLSKERKAHLVEYTTNKIKEVLTDAEFEKLVYHKDLFAKIQSTELIKKK